MFTSNSRSKRVGMNSMSNRSNYSQKTAQVKLNRISAQFKKKFKKGSSTSDLLGTMQSEIGWLGLCVMATCLIILCYVIVLIIYSGDKSDRDTLYNMHPEHKGHTNYHGANSDLPLEYVDPELWDSRANIKRDQQPPPLNRQENINNNNNNNNNNAAAINNPNDIINNAIRNNNNNNNIPDINMLKNNNDKVRQEIIRERQQKVEEIQKIEQHHAAQQRNGGEASFKKPPPFNINDKIKNVLNNANVNTNNINNNNNNNNNNIEGDNNWINIVNYINTIELPNDIPSEKEDKIDEKIYQIKHAFLHAWHGYAKHAMGHDEIQPVSDLPGDSWGGLGATLIDGMDTMMLMQIKEEFRDAMDNLLKINFDVDLQVSFFETTIRHLGGLIGSYEVSKILGSENKEILTKAQQLSDRLIHAFSTEKGIPKSMVNLQTKEIKNYGWTNDKSILSEIGSNQLEFYIMSKYTSNPDYFQKSNNVYNLLHNMSKPDGLYGRLIETNKGEMPNNDKVYTIGGMSDSFYEYLLKLWILTGYKHKLSIKMFVEAMDIINEKLLRKIYDKRKREEPYFFYGELWYNKFRGKLEELDCFMSGLIALASYHIELYFNNIKNTNIKPTIYEQKLHDNRLIYLKLAHLLTESCYQLYKQMPTGLAPESIEFNDNEWNPKEMRYQLRPETLESLYIMYKITGKEIYRQWSWEIFESIEKYCKTNIAYSGIKDVSHIPSEQDNKMESYVMAETFKYLYLTFDDNVSKLISLDKYVFNTEAHPIKIDNES